MTSRQSTASGLRLTETMIGAILDAQIGAHPVLTMPAGAWDVLFDPDGIDFTYALMDGAAVIGLAQKLESSGLGHCCLFDGQAAQDIADAAPWMVRLDVDAALTQDLFTDCTATMRGLWGRNATIILRSSAPMQTLRRWLRRFTRLRDPDAPSAALPRTVCLTHRDIENLSHCKYTRQIEDLAQRLRRAIPREMQAFKPDDQHPFIAQLVVRFQHLGFRQMRSLLLLCGWAIRHSWDLSAMDPDPAIAAILGADKPENVRISELTEVVAWRSAGPITKAAAAEW